jgi:hypothetical protein
MEATERKGFESLFVQRCGVEGHREEVEQLTAPFPKASAFFDAERDDSKACRLSNWKPVSHFEPGPLIS